MFLNLHNVWLLFWLHASSGISFLPPHNPHINLFVLYLVIQELIVNKIHFFKFLSVKDKPWINQLKIISRSTIFSESFYGYKEGKAPTMKGKYPVLRTNVKSHQLFKHTKISYSVASLAFHKFLRGFYQNGLHWVPQSRGTPSTSKSSNHISLISFFGNPDFKPFYKVEINKYIKNWYTRALRMVLGGIFFFAEVPGLEFISAISLKRTPSQRLSYNGSCTVALFKQLSDYLRDNFAKHFLIKLQASNHRLWFCWN